MNLAATFGCVGMGCRLDPIRNDSRVADLREGLRCYLELSAIKSIPCYCGRSRKLTFGRWDMTYYQTWDKVSKLPKSLQWFSRGVCWIITRHELSKTEWGYGGGDKADRWCRWCNKHFEVPRSSILFAFKDHEPKQLMSIVGKKIKDEP